MQTNRFLSLTTAPLLLGAFLLTVTLSDCTCTVTDPWGPGSSVEFQCPVDAQETTATLQLEEFTELLISQNWGANCVLTIEQSIKPALSVQGPKNVVESLKTDYLGEQLSLTIDPCLAQQRPRLIVHLYVTDLRAITSFADGVEVKTIGLTDAGQGRTLIVTVQESSRFDLEVNYRNIVISGHNRGKFTLRGTAEQCSVTLRNSSSLEAFGLETQHAAIENQSVKDADITAVQTLDADIRDAGNIRYKGHPQISESIASGATGRVIDAN